MDNFALFSLLPFTTKLGQLISYSKTQFDRLQTTAREKPERKLSTKILEKKYFYTKYGLAYTKFISNPFKFTITQANKKELLIEIYIIALL